MIVRSVKKPRFMPATMVYFGALAFSFVLSASDGSKAVPRLSALHSSPSEAEVIAALDAADEKEFRLLPFPQVETLVHRSWWNASKKVVVRSHSSRIDFTPAVRKATGEMKKHADLLLRWLDPEFAHPAPISMAVKWSQNKTAILLACRFSPKWDGPGGANVAVFSSEKGKGHIDMERTNQRVREMLSVNISSAHVTADITANAANTRKRFQFNFTLFDEIVPDRSIWTVEFRRAQGSMQMSTGAMVPELRILLRKRWPGPRTWPRLTVQGLPEQEPTWWDEACSQHRSSSDCPTFRCMWVSGEEDADKCIEAHGLAAEDLAVMRATPPRAETGHTCASSGKVFCAATDGCVSDCKDCGADVVQHSLLPRCIRKPVPISEADPRIGDEVDYKTFRGCKITEVYKDGSIEVDVPGLGKEKVGSDGDWELTGKASFHDEDLDPGIISGRLRFSHDVSLLDALDELHFHWGSSATVLLADVTAISTLQVEADMEPSFEIQNGTAVPPAATHLLVVGSNQVGKAIIVATPIIDRVYPPPARGLHFEDKDPHQRMISGSVQIHRAEKEHHIVAYEVHFGRMKKSGELEVFEGGPLKRLSINTGEATDSWLKIDLSGSIKVPKKTTHLIVFSMGSGDVRSKPEAIVLNDIGPPNLAPLNLAVGKDSDPRVNFATFTVSLGRGSCEEYEAANRHRTCDQGTSVAIYLTHENGTRHGAALADRPIDDFLSGYQIADVAVPVGVSHLTARARNANGEMAQGPIAKFSDNLSTTIAAWATSRVLVTSPSDEAWLWRPFSNADSQKLHADFSSAGVTALSLDELGYDAFGGNADGKVSCLDLGSNRVFQKLSGVGRVTTLVANGDKNRVVRGATYGGLDVWDIDKEGGDAHRGLSGHTDEITAINVDWSGEHASTASLDGHIILWNLKNSGESKRASGHDSGVTALATGWKQGLLLSGSVDETLKLWKLQDLSLVATLEGHSEPIRFLLADWEQMRALSMSKDRTVKLWDLQSHECTLTFQSPHESRVLALHVDWPSMQAMAVLEDGNAAIWDLKEPHRNPLTTSAFNSNIKVATIAAGLTKKDRKSRQAKP